MNKEIVFSFVFLLFFKNSFSQEKGNIFILADCLAYAEKHHPSLGIYDNNIAIAKEKSKQSLSSYLPQINSSLVFTDNL